MKIDINKLVVKLIEENSLDEYMNLVTTTKKSMEHPEWLGDFSKEDYINLLKNNSKIYSWFYCNKMIAAGVMIPARQKDIEKFFLLI